jgi:hypothetical protein
MIYYVILIIQSTVNIGCLFFRNAVDDLNAAFLLFRRNVRNSLILHDCAGGTPELSWSKKILQMLISIRSLLNEELLELALSLDLINLLISPTQNSKF